MDMLLAVGTAFGCMMIVVCILQIIHVNKNKFLPTILMLAASLVFAGFVVGVSV